VEFPTDSANSIDDAGEFPAAVGEVLALVIPGSSALELFGEIRRIGVQNEDALLVFGGLQPVENEIGRSFVSWRRKDV